MIWYEGSTSPESGRRPHADLGWQPTSRVVADVYRADPPTTDSLAVLFHSSNGFRHDLTQLAWSLASHGMDALTVTWVSGSPRRAYPASYGAVRELLERLIHSGLSGEGRPLIVVTWCDSSLVALTELNRLAGTGEPGALPPVAVSLAGVLGWPEGIPDAVAGDPQAIEFFGGLAASDEGWGTATPFATLDDSCASMRLISVTTAELLEPTIAYHEAARAIGMRTQLLDWNGPEMEMIVPRLAAGRAVEQLILGADRSLRP